MGQEFSEFIFDFESNAASFQSYSNIHPSRFSHQRLHKPLIIRIFPRVKTEAKGQID